jgi:hypothetical protein
VSPVDRLVAEAIALHDIGEPPRGDYPSRRLWLRAIRNWKRAFAQSPEQRRMVGQLCVVVERELAKRGTVIVP